MRPILLYAPPAAALSLALVVAAQGIEGVPVDHVARIPPGALVDLDSGVVLPVPEQRPLKADLRFDRDGQGFFVAPLFGGMAAAAQDRPPGEDRSTQRLRLGRRDTHPQTCFLRTDRGAVARVTVSVADPYSTASAVLQWVVAPPALDSTVAFDDRVAGSDVFQVRTADGGLASIRISHRDYPRVDLDFVLRCPK